MKYYKDSIAKEIKLKNEINKPEDILKILQDYGYEEGNTLKYFGVMSNGTTTNWGDDYLIKINGNLYRVFIDGVSKFDETVAFYNRLCDMMW